MVGVKNSCRIMDETLILIRQGMCLALRMANLFQNNAFSDVKYIRMIEIARWNTSTTVMESRI
jgi:hypothetical protein